MINNSINDDNVFENDKKENDFKEIYFAVSKNESTLTDEIKLTEVRCDENDSCIVIEKEGNKMVNKNETDKDVLKVNITSYREKQNDDTMMKTSDELVQSDYIKQNTLSNTELNSYLLETSEVGKTRQIKSQEEDISIEDVEQSEECFEDACDALAELSSNGEIVNERNLEESQLPLMSTLPNESIFFSSDMSSEDSSPNVPLEVEIDSHDINSRKGKYNKGRAPPPPDKKIAEQELFEKDMNQSNFPSLILLSECCLHVETNDYPHCDTDTKPLLHQKINDNVVFSDGVNQENIRTTIQTYGNRELSPSPSHSKKESFFRFLPKSGMNSLFNPWAPKDECIRKIPKSRSPVYDKFSRSPSPTSLGDVKYKSGGTFYDHTSRADGKNVGEQVKIREMSQSPSRRRKHD